MRLSFPLACAFIIAGALASGAAETNPRFTGSPFITTWTAEDYASSPINWTVAFNPAGGFVYVGNNYGVLEFDGSEWRRIELTDHSAVHALAIDGQGRVWAGGASDICRLEPDATGGLHAVSMRERLPAAQRSIVNIARSLSTPQGVYFASVTELYFFGNDGSARAWPAEAHLVGLWLMDGMVHVAMNDGAAFQLRDDRLVPLDIAVPPRGSSVTGRKRAFAAERVGDGWLLLTGFGPCRWAGPGASLVPLSAESIAPFGEEQSETAVFLADGRIVYGTTRTGLLVFDRAGRLLQHLTRTDGLPANRIEKISEDAEGGLWIATHTGLARVQLDSPFAVHGLAQGVAASPRDVQRVGDRLYFTHSEGIAWRGPDATIHEVTGPRLGMNKLFVLGDRVLATGPTLRELQTDDESRLLLRHSFSPLLLWPGNPTRIVAGGAEGLSLLTREATGDLRDDGVVKDSPAEIRTLFDPRDGWLWGVALDGRVWRADFRNGPRLDAPLEIFDAARGLPPVRPRDNARLFQLGGQLVAASAAWIRRFDAAAGRFVPETRLTNPELANGAVSVTTDDAGELWLRSPPPTQTLYRLAPSAAKTWRATALPSNPLGALVANDLYHDTVLHTLWLSGQGALVSLDLDWRPSHVAPPLRAFVRRVTLTADGTAAATRDRLLQLTAGQNSMRFDFAAPAYEPDYRGKFLTTYRTRLDGLDADWTPWSSDRHREFSHLPYRAFAFHVQARSLDRRVSDPQAIESVLAFVIAPPWWLTRWVFASYVGLAGLGVVGVVRLRTRGLARRAERLERDVADRTELLRVRNQELARLHQLELDSKISAQLGEQRALLAEEQARLEMLRYQLNPHFLFNALASISGLIVSRGIVARDMIAKLSEFCRTSLARGRDDMTALAEEFHMLQLYLQVEKARWEEGLQVEFVLDDAVKGERLPAFLLLPLVENAVKYGSQTTEEILHVRLSARRLAGGELEIEIANTGRWVVDGETKQRSTHIGLGNLRERMARAFPGRHEFTTEATDGWVRVKLRIAATAASARITAQAAPTGARE